MNQVLLNASASSAAAVARVVTARFTPRTRTAGSPITSPTTTEHRAARIRPNGKPIPRLWAMWLSMNALIPASAFWASEIWPTYPVITTTEKQMQAVIDEEMIADWYSELTNTSAMIPTTMQLPAVTAGRLGRPTAGLWTSVIAPRAVKRFASTIIAIMMKTNGRPSWRPCWGSHVHTVCSLVSSDWSIPSTSPAITTTLKDENRPSRAAPSAGTMNRV